MSWYAATIHLTVLRAEGGVFHRWVGRQNGWWLGDVRRQEGEYQGT